MVGGAALASVALLVMTSTAFAAVHAGPRLSKTVVTFTAPPSTPPGTTWTLNIRQHGALLASASGSSATLTVAVPSTAHGLVQADVRRNTHWYSGNRFVVTSAGNGGGGNGGGGNGGGNGGGGNGGGGKGGGGTSTPPIVVTAGGPKPITKASGGAIPITQRQPVALPSTADTTTPAPAATRPSTPTSALAFTGTSPTLWTLALGGLLLFLAGAYLVRRRPAARRRGGLEWLLRPER